MTNYIPRHRKPGPSIMGFKHRASHINTRYHGDGRHIDYRQPVDGRMFNGRGLRIVPNEALEEGVL